jgi:hypothetical protein
MYRKGQGESVIRRSMKYLCEDKYDKINWHVIVVIEDDVPHARTFCLHFILSRRSSCGFLVGSIRVFRFCDRISTKVFIPSYITWLDYPLLLSSPGLPSPSIGANTDLWRKSATPKRLDPAPSHLLVAKPPLRPYRPPPRRDTSISVAPTLRGSKHYLGPALTVARFRGTGSHHGFSSASGGRSGTLGNWRPGKTTGMSPASVARPALAVNSARSCGRFSSV